MEIVVNEWLLDYLRPDAKEEDKNLAMKFVNSWVQNCHKVVIRRNSPFTSKFYRYMGQSGGDIACRQRFSKLFGVLFLDPERTRILDDCDVKALPKDLADKIPSDDKYLIELWHSVPGSVVVTTDEKLKDSLQGQRPSAGIYLPEEFIQIQSAHG